MLRAEQRFADAREHDLQGRLSPYMSISRSIWKKLAAVSILGLGAGLLHGESAQAATANATLNVSANVVSDCRISTTPVNFGNYDGLAGGPTDAAGTVVVTCTVGLPWEITLGQGSNPDLSVPSTDAAPVRQMADGNGNFLSYGLFTDTARSINWLNVTGAMPAGAGNGLAQTTNVYGRIPAGLNAPVGAYTDSVQATVNY
jgi:spore coat protein U-like protein